MPVYDVKDYIPGYLKKDNPKSVNEKAIKDFIELKVDESLEDLKKLIEDFTDNRKRVAQRGSKQR